MENQELTSLPIIFIILIVWVLVHFKKIQQNIEIIVTEK